MHTYVVFVFIQHLIKNCFLLQLLCLLYDYSFFFLGFEVCKQTFEQ